MSDRLIRFGWRQDLSVRRVLEEHVQAVEQIPYVLIASMDSDCNVAPMPWARKRAIDDPKWALSQSPLVITGQSTARLLDDPELFLGFDEIWFSSHLSETAPPNQASIVAPRRLESELPAPVEAWMLSSRSRIGLGDGEGLNFVGLDVVLARDLGLVST